MRCNGKLIFPDSIFEWCDDKYGFFRWLQILGAPSGEPSGFFFEMPFQQMSKNGEVALEYHEAASFGLSADEAAILCLKQGLERYCLHHPPEQNLIFASWNELGDRALHPSRLPTYSETQYKQINFPYTPFNEKTKVHWIEGFSMIRKCSILVPVQYVYIVHEYINGEKPIFQNLNSGVACSVHKEEAILTSILETIERDGFILSWLNKISPPQIFLSKHHDELTELFNQNFLKPHLKYSILDITTDLGIPTFCVVISQSHGNGPLFSLGAACSLSSRKAIVKATLESTLMRYGLIYLKEEIEEKLRDKSEEAVFSSIKTVHDHFMVFSHPKFINYTTFLNSSPIHQSHEKLPELSSEDPHEDLRYTLETLERKGLDAIIVDIARSELKNFGINVIKTLIPGLQPINSGWKNEFLNNSRLYEIAKTMGYSKNIITEKEINRIPHPFSF